MVGKRANLNWFRIRIEQKAGSRSGSHILARYTYFVFCRLYPSSPPPGIEVLNRSTSTKKLSSLKFQFLFGMTCEPPQENVLCNAVLRIRDVYPGSRIRLFSIPDPGSRIRTVSIPDPGSRILIKEFKYFNPQKSKKNGF